jgi:hypothetical protein
MCWVSAQTESVDGCCGESCRFIAGPRARLDLPTASQIERRSTNGAKRLNGFRKQTLCLH